MNVTFLIGNGFDRGLGLKTNYSHFYEWYCEQETKSNIINDFRQSIDQDIKCTDENTIKLWSDAELGLAKATEKYTVEDFVTCCEDMHDMLSQYIAEQDKKFSDSNESFEKIVKLYSSQIVAFYQNLTPTEQEEYKNIKDKDKINSTYINIITLNYTSTCDKIHKALSKKELTSWSSSAGTRVMKMGSLVHAHGYIDKFPILGVCKPDLIEKKEYLNLPAFRALMIKSESINAVGETWRKDTYSVISKSNIICIFGASLGSSDSDYWEYIAKWLNDAEARRLIIFYYDDKIKQTNISYYQQFTKKQEVRDKFLDFTDYDADTRAKLCGRIHVAINAPKMFVLPEELKVQYPKPKIVTNGRSMSFADTINIQQNLEERIAHENEILEKLKGSTQFDRMTEIEQKLRLY